jgi:hypothetical protein
VEKKKAWRRNSRPKKWSRHSQPEPKLYSLSLCTPSSGRMQDRRRKKIKLLEEKCRTCGRVFYICRACYRGQVYCSHLCRCKGYRENQRRARKKYRSSQKGKLNRRIAARRYRLKEFYKSQTNLKSKRYQLEIKSRPLSTIKIPNAKDSIPTCQFCGRKGYVVKEFPRRPYGKKSLQDGYI